MPPPDSNKHNDNWFKQVFIFIKNWAEVLVFFVITLAIILLLTYKFIGFKYFYINEQLDFFTTLQADSIKLYSEEKGIVAKILVNTGDVITEGQLLALVESSHEMKTTEAKTNTDAKSNLINKVYNIEIKDIELKEDVFISQLKLEKLTQELKHANIILKNLRKEHLVVQELFDNNAATIDELNKSLDKLVNAKQEKENIELDILQYKKKINFQKNKLQKIREKSEVVYDLLEDVRFAKTPSNESGIEFSSYEINSPVNGTLISTFITTGLYIPMNQKLFSIGFQDKLRIILPLSGYDLNLANKVEMEGVFKSSLFPADIFKAKIVHIRGNELELEIENTANKLQPGQQGILTLNRRNNHE